MDTLPKETVYAFIDSQNLNLGVKKQGWEVDFKKFFIFLQAQYKVSKAFLFIGYIPRYSKMYIHLRETGYTLIFKPTVEFVSKDKSTAKGNVDAELVLHAMIQWPNYDKAILVSGDGDFHCLVEHLHKNNKLLKMIAPTARYSSLLRKFAAYLVLVEHFKTKVQKGEAFPRHG